MSANSTNTTKFGISNFLIATALIVFSNAVISWSLGASLNSFSIILSLCPAMSALGFVYYGFPSSSKVTIVLKNIPIVFMLSCGTFLLLKNKNIYPQESSLSLGRDLFFIQLMSWNLYFILVVMFKDPISHYYGLVRKVYRAII